RPLVPWARPQPLSSPRRRGPITTKVCVIAGPATTPCCGVWVPACAGTTTENRGHKYGQSSLDGRRSQMTANLLILTTIGFVQLLAVMSPGPSFLITARTAIARSRADGVKVALGLGAGTIVWSTAALLGLHFLLRQFHCLFFV